MSNHARIFTGKALLALVASFGAAGFAQSPPTDPIINEFVFNHTGTDFNEYVEILGDPNTDYLNFWVVAVDGESTASGGIDFATRFGTTDARGLRTTLYQVNDFENGTQTILLVEDFTGQEGDDLDTDNNGTLDVEPWSRIVDSLAVTDGGGSDNVYSGLVFAGGFDGISFAVAGASRIPNGNNSTGTTADWVRNDFDNEGVPGFGGSLASNEALNTPADPNALDYASGGGAAPSGLSIHDIQGTGFRSVFEGQTVSFVSGVVTAIDNSPFFAQGFYMQETSPDADPRTSEGIFVLTGGDDPASDLGDQGLFSTSHPPTLVSEAQRLQQARRVNEVAEDLLAADEDAFVAVAGDLNDFQFSPPLDLLKNGDAAPQELGDTLTLPTEERYTFIFQGNSQTLDGVLGSRQVELRSGGDIVHVASEFPEAPSSDPWTPDFQASDHDPIVTRILCNPLRPRQVARRLGTSEGDRRFDPRADIDADGEITVEDLQRSIAIFGGGDDDDDDDDDDETEEEDDEDDDD